MIKYQIENYISAIEFKELLIKSTLGERRPVDDFVYCTYLSDLAVDDEYQKQGIGKELIRLTKKETPKATTILLAAPKAIDYYPHIGMSIHKGCFLLKDENELK